MKKNFFLLILLICLSLFSFLLFLTKDERDIKKTLKEQLNQIKACDTEVLSLFYQNFSYQIKHVSVHSENAVASVKIKTLDAKTLARDFTKQTIEQRLQKNANEISSAAFTLEQSCFNLKDLISTNHYKFVSSNVKIKLIKQKGQWNIVHTKDFDNALVGNFFEHMKDPYLLSPEDIVTVYFNAIKKFNQEELLHYLCLNKLLSSTKQDKQDLIVAVAEQISTHFDYTISEKLIDKHHAVVYATVTGIDFQEILNSYREEISTWLKTSEALSSGSDGRRKKELELLIDCIKNNNKTSTKQSEIHLMNDGIGWELEIDSEIPNAIFGNLETVMDSISENN